MVTYTRRPLFIRGSSTTRGTYWRGSTASDQVPDNAILTEDDIPILTELGEYILTES